MASSDRKMILDDEMSRFEAAVLGSSDTSLAQTTAQPFEASRPIIGANTFQQVQQQLNRNPPQQPLGPLPHPPAPPNFPSFNSPSQQPFGFHPPVVGPRVATPFAPPNVAPNVTAPPSGFNPPGVASGFNPPNAADPSVSGGFNSRPQDRFGDNSLYKRREDIFNPHSDAPSFLPPQLSRHNSANSSGHGLRNINSHLPPPPPPPDLKSKSANKQSIAKGPVIYKASATVITSESKGLSAKASGELPASTSTSTHKEPKKKKQKSAAEDKLSSNNSSSKTNAERMADKVKESTKTSITAAPKAFPPPKSKKDKKIKKNLRYAGGQVWEDKYLEEWDKGDFRLFVGDLGNDVTDDFLTRHFNHLPSFSKARVVRDKRTNKTKGYGFISFKEPQDYIRAIREMNGKYLGSRPIKLRKSTWKDRSLDTVYKKMKEKAAAGLKF